MKKGAIVTAMVFATAMFAVDGRSCDEHGKAAKAKTAQASGMSCSKDAHAKTADAKGGHAAHAMMSSGSGKSCDMKAKAAEAKVVQLDGKILCKHCNLHQTEKCEKVFQSADQKTMYNVCPESKVDVEKISEEGTANLRVSGKIVKCGGDGGEVLLIEKAAKI